MTLDEHMTCLRVHQAVEQPALTVQAYADASAYGHVGHHLAALSCAVHRFPQRRTIHVGVKLDGNGKGPGKGAYEIHILPALLRRSLDVAVGRGLLLQIQRPEAGNPQGFDVILLEPGNNLRQHLGCGGGRKSHFRKDTDGAVLHFSYTADNFSAACFNTAD